VTILPGWLSGRKKMGPFCERQEKLPLRQENRATAQPDAAMDILAGLALDEFLSRGENLLVFPIAERQREISASLRLQMPTVGIRTHHNALPILEREKRILAWHWRRQSGEGTPCRSIVWQQKAPVGKPAPFVSSHKLGF